VDYNQKQLNNARGWFTKAKGYSSSRAHAEGWLAHLDEQQRIQIPTH
jgi:hypothetical protein